MDTWATVAVAIGTIGAVAYALFRDLVVTPRRRPKLELRTEARLESACDTVRQIAIRYLGERDGAAYADSGADDTLIRRDTTRHEATYVAAATDLAERFVRAAAALRQA